MFVFLSSVSSYYLFRTGTALKNIGGVVFETLDRMKELKKRGVEILLMKIQWI